jgi:hypothetical protein
MFQAVYTCLCVCCVYMLVCMHAVIQNSRFWGIMYACIFLCVALCTRACIECVCARSMRSMCGGFISRNWGPSLKVHHGQCLTSMTKHDSGASPPGATCDSAKPPHDKAQGSASGWRSHVWICLHILSMHVRAYTPVFIYARAYRRVPLCRYEDVSLHV